MNLELALQLVRESGILEDFAAQDSCLHDWMAGPMAVGGAQIHDESAELHPPVSSFDIHYIYTRRLNLMKTQGLQDSAVGRATSSLVKYCEAHPNAKIHFLHINCADMAYTVFIGLDEAGGLPICVLKYTTPPGRGGPTV